MSIAEQQEPASTARRPRRIAFAAIGALVVALPFLLYLVTLPRYGALARNDYFGDLVMVRDGDHFSHDPARWLLARSNEHRITLPLLVWAANVALTHGDNRAISAFSFLLLLVTFRVLLGWLPREMRDAPGWFWPAAAVLAAFVVTPMAAHNWALGFSGTQWFMANLSAVGALGLAVSARPEDANRRLVWAVLAGVLGAFAHSTHLALWPALALALVLVPGPRWRWFWVAGGAAAVYALYALTYSIPSGHPHPTAEPLAVAHFVLLYLGALVSETSAICLGVGVVGIALGLIAVWLAVRERDPERRRPRALFLALAVYAFFNAVGSAVARVGFGFEMALSSRYASLPSLFWIGVLGVLAVTAWQRSGREGARPRIAGAGVLALSLLVVAPMEVSGIERLRLQLARAAAQPFSALALHWGSWDAAALAIVGATRSPGVKAGIEFQRDLGHVPFDIPDAWPRGARLPPDPSAAPPYDGVRIEGADPSNDRVFVRVRAARRGHEVGEEPSRVLLADGGGAVRGALVATRLPSDPTPILGATPPPTVWLGFLERAAAVETLSAWGVFGTTLRPMTISPKALQQMRDRAGAPPATAPAPAER